MEALFNKIDMRVRSDGLEKSVVFFFSAIPQRKVVNIFRFVQMSDASAEIAIDGFFVLFEGVAALGGYHVTARNWVGIGVEGRQLRECQ